MKWEDMLNALSKRSIHKLPAMYPSTVLIMEYKVQHRNTTKSKHTCPAWKQATLILTFSTQTHFSPVA